MRNSISLVLGLFLAIGAAPTVGAQDAQPVSATTTSSSSSGSSNSGIAIEFQGRLSVLSLFDATNGTPRAIPPVTMGVRLLDQRLFLGVGVSWNRSIQKVCPGGGADCDRNGDTSMFAIVPTVSFDVLNRGPAHLYPVAMVHLGMLDTGLADNDFLWGANVGIGLRGDIGDVVSIGSEWGYGFLRYGDNPGDAKIRIMDHGFWGTVNLSARIGL